MSGEAPPLIGKSLDWTRIFLTLLGAGIGLEASWKIATMAEQRLQKEAAERDAKELAAVVAAEGADRAAADRAGAIPIPKALRDQLGALDRTAKP